MLAELAAIVAPVFLLAGVGFVWVRTGTPYDVAFVTRLMLLVGTPCLIFSTLSKTQLDPQAFAAIAYAALALYLVLGALAFALLRALGLSMRTWLSPFVFSNSGNIGLPLCLFAFGEEGLAYGIVIFAAMVISNFTVGVWIVSGRPAPWQALKQPMVYAVMLGALFLVQGWSVPRWIDNAVSLTGQMVIPLMLVTLGASIARLPAAAPWRTIGLSAAKIGLSGLVAFAIARVMGLEGVAFGVFVIQSVTPVPVTSYLLAERFDAGAAEVARFVMVSTALAVLVIPAVLGLLV